MLNADPTKQSVEMIKSTKDFHSFLKFKYEHNLTITEIPHSINNDKDRMYIDKSIFRLIYDCPIRNSRFIKNCWNSRSDIDLCKNWEHIREKIIRFRKNDQCTNNRLENYYKMLIYKKQFPDPYPRNPL